MLLIYLHNCSGVIPAPLARSTPHYPVLHKVFKSSDFYTTTLPVAGVHALPGAQQVVYDTMLFKALTIGEQKILFTGVWFLSKYLRHLAGCFTGFETEWHFLNLESFGSDESCYRLWYHVYRTRSLSSFFTKRVDFVVLFTKLSFFRDPTALTSVVRKQLLQTHLKQHTRVFYSISTFLAKWYDLASEAHKLRGYTVFFKGKLARKGSVRKSVFFKKSGAVSFTNKSLRVNYRNYFIWTYTGVIGAGVALFYHEYVYIYHTVHLPLLFNTLYTIFIPVYPSRKPWLH